MSYHRVTLKKVCTMLLHNFNFKLIFEKYRFGKYVKYNYSIFFFIINKELLTKLYNTNAKSC